MESKDGNGHPSERTGPVVVLALSIAGFLAYWIFGSGAIPASDLRSAEARPTGPFLASDSLPPIEARYETAGMVANEVLPLDRAGVDPDRDILGKVLDEDGFGVSGAVVDALKTELGWRASPGGEGRPPVQVWATTVSGADGTFVVRLAWGEVVDLRVSAEGFARGAVPGVNAGETVELVLLPGCEVQVHARNEDGTPVEDLSVELWPRTSGEVQGSHRLMFESRTDSTGCAVLSGVAPGSAILLCRHAEFATCSEQIRVSLSGENSHAIVVPEGRVISGRVLCRDSGEGVADARIRSSASHTLKAEVVSDIDGYFEWPGFRNGDGELYIDAEGYALATRYIDPRTSEYEIELERGYGLTGIVRDEEGPVVGARVRVLGCRGWISSFEIDDRSATTDARGRFELASLRYDFPHLLSIFASDRAPFFLLLDHGGPHGESMDLGEIRLTKGVRVSGVVLNEAHEFVEGARVTLVWPSDGGGDCQPEGETRRADEHGRFRFINVAAGTHRLRVESEGSKAKEVSIYVADSDVQDLEVVLGSGISQKVRVRDSLGDPVPNVRWSAAWVNEPGGRTRLRTAVSNERGEALLEGLPRREILFNAVPPRGYKRPSAKARIPGEEPLDFEIDRVEVVEGWAYWANGEPAEGLLVSVDARDREAKPVYAETDRDGAFRVSCSASWEQVDLDVAYGRRAKAHASSEELVVLECPQGVIPPTRNLRIEVARRTLEASLHVQVVDAESRPLAGCLVVARSASFGTVEGRTGEDGVCILRGLDATTTYRLQAFPRPGATDAFVSREVEAVADSGEWVTLRVRDGFRVSGTVAYYDEAPAARVWVLASDLDGLVARVVTNDSGAFAFVLPADGIYRLRVTSDRDGEMELPSGRGIEVSARTEGLLLDVGR